MALGRDVVLGTALGFVAGFVDAAGFIALSGLFTAHVTGNFVMIGVDLFSASNGVLAKILALPAFVLGVVATRLLSIFLERHDAPPLPWLFALQALFLGGFCSAGIMLTPLGSPDSPGAIGVGMLGVGAMGIQNAITRLSLAHLAATTVMTVNVTQAVLDLVDLFRGAVAKPSPERTRLDRMVPAIIAFAAGALAGAFGVATLSFWCLIVPIFILLALVTLTGLDGGARPVPPDARRRHREPA